VDWNVGLLLRPDVCDSRPWVSAVNAKKPVDCRIRQELRMNVPLQRQRRGLR
jgi:hypothetical protein